MYFAWNIPKRNHENGDRSAMLQKVSLACYDDDVRID
jgi:hypothetical protein